MGQRPIRQIPIGFPQYGPQRGNSVEDAHAALYAIGGVYQYKRISDIAPEVKIGDVIWFNRTVLHREENMVDEFDRDGAKIFVFRVEYDLVICIEKEEPVMIGGWCFLEPMFENWKKQKVPTFYDTVGANGQKLPRPENEWIVLAAQPAQEKLRAILKHFGTPMNGDKFYYQKNAEVFMRKQKQWKYKYKDTEFMLCYQWDLFAEVIEDQTISK
jgi:hypothetical protein